MVNGPGTAPREGATSLAKDAELSAIVSAVREYQGMPGFHAAEGLFRDVLSRNQSANPELATQYTILEPFIRTVGGNYLQASQYHNFVHALEFMSYQQAFSGSLGLLKTKQDALEQIVACVYHDVGNGPIPGMPGVDETRAVERFLKDLTTAHSKSSADPHELPLLNVGVDGAVRIVSYIASTVFRDRLASPQLLAQQPYVSEIAQALIKTFPDLESGSNPDAALVAMKNRLVTEMAGPVAATFRHADIASSLVPMDSIKNSLTNRWEDRKNQASQRSRIHWNTTTDFLNFSRESCTSSYTSKISKVRIRT